MVWLRNGNFMTGLVVERVSGRELEEDWSWDPGQKWICCVFCWDIEIKCFFVAIMMFDYGGVGVI